MRPLWDILRPKTFDQVFGQNEALDFLKNIKKPISILLFGPPGCGKTTIAKIYASRFDANFISLSAVSNGINDIKKAVQDLEKNPFFNKPTILFIDEIHRFNKAQQDYFLPLIENGILTLVSATTENPSFCVNSALLSRLRVLKLNLLNEKDLINIITLYEKEKTSVQLTAEIKNYLIKLSQGDARHLINLIENLESINKEKIDLDDLKKVLQKRFANFDKDGENHYNLISALHKSIRGSDPDASLYWLNRMLLAKEDPLFIARRLIRIADEDVGLADINALNVAILAYKTYSMLGSPEGELSIAKAVVYLALSPKSNSAYLAYEASKKLAEQTLNIPPPMHILNAPSNLMKDLGYSKGYVYDHDTQNGFSGQNYFPDTVNRESFYHPKEIGFERELKKRVEYFHRLRSEQIK